MRFGMTCLKMVEQIQKKDFNKAVRERFEDLETKEQYYETRICVRSYLE
jgi:hypothetical protein